MVCAPEVQYRWGARFCLRPSAHERDAASRNQRLNTRIAADRSLLVVMRLIRQAFPCGIRVGLCLDTVFSVHDLKGIWTVAKRGGTWQKRHPEAPTFPAGDRLGRSCSRARAAAWWWSATGTRSGAARGATRTGRPGCSGSHRTRGESCGVLSAF